MCFDSLELSFIKWYVFVNSDHNLKFNQTTQLRVINFLDNVSNRYHSHHWASTKTRQITSLMKAAEGHAFSQGYECVFSKKLMLKQLGALASRFIFTDAKSIFDRITASKRLH